MSSNRQQKLDLENEVLFLNSKLSSSTYNTQIEALIDQSKQVSYWVDDTNAYGYLVDELRKLIK